MTNQNPLSLRSVWSAIITAISSIVLLILPRVVSPDDQEIAKGILSILVALCVFLVSQFTINDLATSQSRGGSGFVVSVKVQVILFALIIGAVVRIALAASGSYISPLADIALVGLLSALVYFQSKTVFGLANTARTMTDEIESVRREAFSRGVDEGRAKEAISKFTKFQPPGFDRSSDYNKPRDPSAMIDLPGFPFPPGEMDDAVEKLMDRLVNKSQELRRSGDAPPTDTAP